LLAVYPSPGEGLACVSETALPLALGHPLLVSHFLFIRWIAARTTLQLLGIGLLWVVLTVSFEIGLGRLVLGLPWDRITEDYDPARGGFLGFGLLFMAVSPILAARVRGEKPPRSRSSP